MRLTHLLLLCPLLLTTPAFAQDASRIEQLEEQLMLLQRKVDRNTAAAASGSTSAPSPDGGVGIAQTDARIAALEEEIRNLRGTIEQKDFENRRLADELERFKKDTEFRLGEIEKATGTSPATPPATPGAAPATPPAATPAAPAPAPEAAKPAPAGEKKKLDVSVKEVPAGQTETPNAAATAGDTPRDHYNYAFRLLNQNQYEEAQKSFAEFAKKYPKDPLAGNAYYWQGETYYIRKDYEKAADNFRVGYEAMPNGPKAADNLLKLGMSLSALKKKEEACVVLSQVMDKYKTSSANTAAKAQAEHKRNGC